jgi:CubicO group peptidase (beta-lactamase class C family)
MIRLRTSVVGITMIALIAAWLLAFGACTAEDQDSTGNQVGAADSVIAMTEVELKGLLFHHRSAHNVPGLAGAFITPDTILTAWHGVRDVISMTPLEAEDRFHIGSNTKAMTAFVAARLVAQGKLSWGITIAEAFPEWDDIHRH